MDFLVDQHESIQKTRTQLPGNERPGLPLVQWECLYVLPFKAVDRSEFLPPVENEVKEENSG